MISQCPELDLDNALTYLGKTVLVELVWEDEPESFWQCMHIVGAVLPMEGIYKNAYFLTFEVSGKSQFPNEVFLSDIRTIRAVRHRDRQSSGNVLGRIAHPVQAGSRAALPARRNSFTVPSNGSTGAAHP